MKEIEAVFIHSPDLDLGGYPIDAPFNIWRARMVSDNIHSKGLIDGRQHREVEPAKATRPELEKFHAPRYLDAMIDARNEVDRVLSGGSQPPGIDQINNLVFIDQVIKEALRLYPPIHVGNRMTAEDLQLLGYHVPRGTRVMYSIFLSHRQEEYWEQPEEFKPQRFDRSAEAHRPPFTYVPFGGGPRNCIGAAFAQVESKVVVARLLQQFELVLTNGHEIKPYMGATLEPRPGVNMLVGRRHFDA